MAMGPTPAALRVLFVCKGNICRSAAAEAVARELAGGHVAVRSRGTREWHEGKPANEMMRDIALGRGYDMESHIAHQLTQSDLCWATLIVAFDDETLTAVKRQLSSGCSAALRLFSRDGRDVGDPYGHSASVFEECFDQIEIGVRQIVDPS